MCTSTAFQLPSCSGSAVEPTNDPGLMSAIEALISATTLMLSAIFTFSISPSRALTVSIDPSTCSTVPRTRTGLSCADADTVASAAAHSAPNIIRAIMTVSLHRWRAGAADIERLRHHRAIRLLFRRHDDDRRAGFELVFVSGRDRGDHRLWRDHNLLLAVLVFHRQRFAILSSHHVRHISIGHGAARPRVPIEVTIGHHAALRGQEDVDRECLDALCRSEERRV